MSFKQTLDTKVLPWVYKGMYHGGAASLAYQAFTRNHDPVSNYVAAGTLAAGAALGVHKYVKNKKRYNLNKR